MLQRHGMSKCLQCRGQGYINIEEKHGIKKEICFRCLGRGSVADSCTPVVTGLPPQSSDVDYAHMLNAIISRWEYATKRFIAAESMLVDMYPWYKRIFVAKKIRKYIMNVKSYENTEGAVNW